MRIIENCDCSIKLLPITNYPKNTSLYNPTWEDSGILTLIYKISTDNSQELVYSNSNLHVIDGKPLRDVQELPILSDGWYKIVSLIVPTKLYLLDLGMVNGFDDIEYQRNYKDTDNELLNETTIIVAADEESPTGYSFLGRLSNPSPYRKSNLYYWLQITDINDLIDEYLNREIVNEHLYGTNIKITVEDYFKYCDLKKCFVNKATNLLSQYRGCDGSYNICSNKSNMRCKSDIDEYSIQIRDYLWMTVNAIKYALECSNYETANNLLNCISGCNGICNENNKTKTDCGCS